MYNGHLESLFRDLKSDIHFLCVDKRAISDNKTYIVLENGDRVLLHPDVTKVPALMLLYKNNENIFFN